jgi:hypothetical protein
MVKAFVAQMDPAGFMPPFKGINQRTVSGIDD